VTKLDIRIAFGHENLSFELNELAKTRLLVLLGQVATGRAHEEDVLYTSLLGGVDELHRDVELVLVGWWNQAYGVDFRVLESLNHVSDAAGLVRDNFCAQLLKSLTLGASRVERQTGDRVNLLGEVLVGEKELADQISGLAICGGDTDITRHDGRRLVER